MHDDFELRERVTAIKDGSVIHEHYDEKENVLVSYAFECLICGYIDEFYILEKCPVCYAPADKHNKSTRPYNSQDNHLIKLINEKSKLSKSECE